MLPLIIFLIFAIFVRRVKTVHAVAILRMTGVVLDNEIISEYPDNITCIAQHAT